MGSELFRERCYLVVLILVFFQINTLIIIIFIFDFWELYCSFSWRLDNWSSFRAFQDFWSSLLTISFTKLVTEYLDSGSCIYQTELSCDGSPASRTSSTPSLITSIISKNLAYYPTAIAIIKQIWFSLFVALWVHCTGGSGSHLLRVLSHNF